MRLLLIAALLSVSIVYADDHGKEADHAETTAANLPEDKLAGLCAYLEDHILDTHENIVEIDGKSSAARDVGVTPSGQMQNASNQQWAHQAQDASIYGNLRCFERGTMKFRYEQAQLRMQKRRDRKDKGWFD